MNSSIKSLYQWFLKNNLKDEAESLLKFAGHKEDLIAKYPQHADELNLADQEGVKPAFLGWVAKQLNNEEPIREIISMINEYVRFNKNLEKKDLYQYSSLGELRHAIENTDSKTQERKKNREMLNGDFEKIYEDEEFTVVHPYSREASCHFGQGTQWCVSATISENYFNSYSASNVFLYFILRKKRGTDVLGYNSPVYDKIAFAYHKQRSAISLEIFDAQDTKIDDDDVAEVVGYERYSKIHKIMMDNLNSQKKTKLVETITNMTIEGYNSAISKIKSLTEREQFKKMLRDQTFTSGGAWEAMALENEWMDEERTEYDERIVNEKIEIMNKINIFIHGSTIKQDLAKKIYREFSKDSHVQRTREAAAQYCPFIDVLEEMVETDSDRVKLALAKRTQLPAKSVEKLYRTSKNNTLVVAYLIEHPNTSDELLHEILHSSIALAQNEVFQHKNHISHTRLIASVASSSKTSESDLYDIYAYTNSFIKNLKDTDDSKERSAIKEWYIEILSRLARNIKTPNLILEEIIKRPANDRLARIAKETLIEKSNPEKSTIADESDYDLPLFDGEPSDI